MTINVVKRRKKQKKYEKKIREKTQGKHRKKTQEKHRRRNFSPPPMVPGICRGGFPGCLMFL